MKKLLSYVVLALVSTFVFVGCNKPTETTPPAGSTNAPTTTNAAPANP